MHSIYFQTNQVKNTNMKQERSVKKESYSQFVIVSYIFLLYGINLNFLNKSRIKRVLLWFIRKFIALFHIYSFVVTVFSFYEFQYKSLKIENLKQKMAQNISNLVTIILWYAINRRSKDLRCLFEFEDKQKNNFQISNAFYMKIFTILWPALTLIIAFKLSSPIRYIDIYFFNFLNSSKCYCSFLHYIITFLWVALYKTFVSCVVILYTVACNHFQNVITTYQDANTELITSKKNSNEILISRLCVYESIIKGIRKFESIMTFPIFITFLCNVIEAFYGMRMILNKSDHTIILKKIAYLTRGFVSIFLITYTASNVNEADQKAKVSNDELLRNSFTVSNLSSLETKLNLIRTNEKSALTLTAWSFFKFKRSFVFAAIGCVFTYASLFINLEM